MEEESQGILIPNSNGNNEIAYHNLGVRLVASTYSPHRQASPPITRSFCFLVPTFKSLSWNKLSSSGLEYKRNADYFYLNSMTVFFSPVNSWEAKLLVHFIPTSHCSSQDFYSMYRLMWFKERILFHSNLFEH